MIGTIHGATVTGRAWKRTQCTHCCTPYVYLNEQTGYGEGGSIAFVNAAQGDATAVSGAERALANNLETKDALARCPNCNLYQPSMILHGRRERSSRAVRRGLKLTLIPVFACGIAAALFTKHTDWFLVGMFGSGLLGLIVTICWALVLRLRFDPNTGRNYLMPPNEDIASSGLTVSDFEQLTSEQT